MCFYYTTAFAETGTSCITWASDGNKHNMIVAVSDLTLRLLVDGVFVGESTLSGVVADGAAQFPAVTLGVREPGAYFFHGQIYDVQLYYRTVI